MPRNNSKKTKKTSEITTQNVIPKTIQKNSPNNLQILNLTVNLEGLNNSSSLYSLVRRWMKNGSKEEEIQEEIPIRLAPPTPINELKMLQLKNNNYENCTQMISPSEKKLKRDNIEKILISTGHENKVLPPSEMLLKNLKEEAIKTKKLKIRDYENRLVRYSQRLKSLLDDWNTFDESLALGLHSMKKTDGIKK